MLFLGIQMKEYSALFHEGFNISSSIFGSCFFTLTGFHGAHVFAGVLWLVIVFAQSFGKRFSRDQYCGVEMVGLYWHFVEDYLVYHSLLDMRQGTVPRLI